MAHSHRAQEGMSKSAPWARGLAEQVKAKMVKKPAGPVAPTIRDDAWWVDRMSEWRKDDPDRPFPRGKLNFWLELTPAGSVRDVLTDDMQTNLDQVLGRMMAGEPLPKIAEWITELFGLSVSPSHLRAALTSTPTRLARYNLAREQLAHHMVDEVIADADSARRVGDYRWSGTIRLKLAGHLAPKEYGDKGRGGDADDGVVTPSTDHAVPGQTPAEALKAMLG